MSDTWSLLLYTLPRGKGGLRVEIWRQLRRFGCLPLNTSAYVLPDQPSCHERLQWIAKRILDGGGEATVSKVLMVEGLTNNEMRERFKTQCNEEYLKILKEATALKASKEPAKRACRKLERLKLAAKQVRESDYFGASKAGDLEAALTLLEQKFRGDSPKNLRPTLDVKTFLGRTWVTRPFPEIDRCASAWLIRKFIDAKAVFRFSPQKPRQSEVLTYDMLDADFSHEGDQCTFETLCKRFALQDPVANRIGEMIHDADLEDEKFGRQEAVGIELVLKGFARQGKQSEEILKAGMEIIEGLYLALGGKRNG